MSQQEQSIQAAASTDPIPAGDDLITWSAGQIVTPGPTLRRAFQTGDLCANRYKVLRFLAQGGMGEVYEVEDLELKERVALKTIRPEIAEDERTAERFKREIQLARKVTHPNVCRIFEFGVHRQLDGPGILFLTMELLQGETLATYLRRSGKLKPAEAFPIIRQIVDALAAAHKAGIVHRDFKGANVLLVPVAEGLRAVVTDFGLAQACCNSDNTVTGTRTMVGTPAYMAPEQIRGEDLTPSVDIYALGIVLYEMLTGVLPFQGEMQAVLVRRLYEDPTPPRQHGIEIDPRWERTILRCLERDPQDRFSRVSEVVQALDGELIPLSRRQRRFRRRVVAGSALALLLAVGASMAWLKEEPTSWRNFALLGFKNLTGNPDADYVSMALTEGLSANLNEGNQLQLIPGESIARMKREFSLADADSYSKETLEKIRGNLRTDLVVLGSYLILGDGEEKPIGLNVRVQDTRTGKLLTAFHEEGVVSALPELIARTGAHFRQELNLEPVPIQESPGFLGGLPTRPDAIRHYSDGLRRLRDFDAQGAREAFRKAVEAEPNNPLPHSALAEAYDKLGYAQEARREAEAASRLSSKLTLADRLDVEARSLEAAGDWKQAIGKWSFLVQYYRDNLEYGLRLASAQIQGEQPSEALKTLSGLRQLKPPANEDVRIDLLELRALGAKTDFRGQKLAADRIIEKAEKQGAALVVAEARLASWRALMQLGDNDAAMAACVEASKVFERMGNSRAQAQALEGVGYLLRWPVSKMSKAESEKALESSKQAYERAIRLSRQAEDLRTLGSALRGLGLVYHEQHQAELAKAKYQEALEVFRKIPSASGEAWVRTSLGYELYNEPNQLEEAAQEFDRAQRAFLELEEIESAANSLRWLGMTRGKQGRTEEARAIYEQALELSLRSGNTAGAKEALGGIIENFYRANQFQEALAWLEQRGASKLDQDLRAALTMTRSDTLFKLGRLPEARRAMEEAEALSKKPKPELQLGFAGLLLLQGEMREANLRLEKLQEQGFEDKLLPSFIGTLCFFEVPINPALLERLESRLRDLEAPHETEYLRSGLYSLGNAWLRQGRADEAGIIFATSMAWGKETPEPPRTLEPLLAWAEAEAARGHVPQAVGALQTVQSWAHQKSCLLEEMRARLVLGRLALGNGGNRDELERLEKEARERGFEFFARKAAEALSRQS